MACYAPKPVILGRDQTTNKRKIFFIDRNTAELNKNWKNQLMIPCKKCIGCKIDHAKEWATRAQLEAKEHEYNYFLTLTYNENNLPKNKEGISNIELKDWKRFINSLRKNHERKGHTGIKYLTSAEYGSRRGRPHFHACIFNMPIYDLKKSNISKKSKKQLYQSKEINKIWGKGIVEIGIVTYESAGYTASYTFKKLNKTNYKELKINPEKLLMSKGIGLKNYNKEIEKIKVNDNMPIKTKNGTKIIRAPKYFDRQLEKTDPETLKALKEIRTKMAIKRTEAKLEANKLTWTENNGLKQREIWNKLKNKKTL